MCAGFFIAAIWTRSWRLPLIGVGLLTVLSIVAGGLYPAAVQSLKVRPSEKSLEAQYIQRNIDATRAAFAIDGIKKTPYAATTDAAPGQLREDAETIPGIRLVDPNVVSPTFRQFEGLRQYYAFPDILDVDRYAVDDKKSDSIVAVRELNLAGVPEEQRNWLNDHTVYTHGFGFIGAYGNKRTTEGDPQFFSSGFSTKGPMGMDYEPRIYFGEQSPSYSIVGAPEGAKPREFDFPDDKGEGGQANNTFDGKGGVAIGSFVRKIAYAVKYREPKFLLSDAVNSDSRILDHRQPRERVERVAPWLTIDGNAYPAVVDGRVKWIVDGYTTTQRYPNSKLTDLSEATVRLRECNFTHRCHWCGPGQLHPQLGQGHGRCGRRLGQALWLGHHRPHPQGLEQGLPRFGVTAFGDVLAADVARALPAGPLQGPAPAPVELSRDRRELLLWRWRLLADPQGPDPRHRHPGPAGLLPVPGHAGPDCAGVLADDDVHPLRVGPRDPAWIPGRGFRRRGGGGQTRGDLWSMRLLELPRNSAVDGPGQVQNQIEVSTARSQSPSEPLNLSQFIAQNRQAGKQLTYGNLLTLPVGEGLLYVQPMYVQASREGGSFPQNKATVAVFGKRIAWGETLDQALDGLFGGNSGADAGDVGVRPRAQLRRQRAGDAADHDADAQLAEIIADIEAANAAGQAALKKGDFAAYGVAQKDLQDAIARAAAAQSAAHASACSERFGEAVADTDAGARRQRQALLP